MGQSLKNYKTEPKTKEAYQKPNSPEINKLAYRATLALALALPGCADRYHGGNPAAVAAGAGIAGVAAGLTIGGLTRGLLGLNQQSSGLEAIPPWATIDCQTTRTRQGIQYPDGHAEWQPAPITETCSLG